MGGASSNNDAETCILPKTTNYIETISDNNTKNLNYNRSTQSITTTTSGNNIVVTTASIGTTMSAPTTRSKRKLMNDGETSTITTTTVTTSATATSSIGSTTIKTATTTTTLDITAQPSRNNSISVNNKSVKLDIKDTTKENVRNQKIQPQISVTTRRSAAAAAAAAAASATTIATTNSAITTTVTIGTSLLTAPLKTKTSITSGMGKKSEGAVRSEEDNRSIIVMRSGSSVRKNLVDRDDGGGSSSSSSSTSSSCGGGGSGFGGGNNTNFNKLNKKNNCINDVAAEDLKESHKDDKNEAKAKSTPIAVNIITKSSEIKDTINSNINVSKNPATSSCDIEDKQLNAAGEMRKVEPLKINLNRDIAKPTKITIKPIVKSTLFTIEKDGKEKTPPTSPIPKLTIKSTSSSSSTIITPISSSSNSSSDSMTDMTSTESQHLAPLQLVHTEPHIVPKLTIRTSDNSNNLTNSDITHSVVPKLTIKMDCTSNCVKDSSSSSPGSDSPSTSSPSPPPLPLPKLTIKTSSDTSEATILSSSCSPQKVSTSSLSSSTVCHIVGTSKMTSSLSSSQTSVPKLTIKTIQIPSSSTSSSVSCCDTPTIPKLTIRPIPSLAESEDSVRTDDESLSETDTSSWQQKTQGIIPKLTIRTSGQEPSIKVHEPETNSSSNSSSSINNSINQSIPKLTIRTKIDQDSSDKVSTVPKFTIKSVQDSTQSIPKLTISVSDQIATSSSSLSPPPEKIPKLTVRQVESDETERVPKLMISRHDGGEESNEKVPKITIKGIQEFDSTEKVPKLTIKPIQEPSSSDDNVVEKTEKLPKLTIKPIIEPEIIEKIPKITIKPLQDPEENEKAPSFKVTVLQNDSENYDKIPKLTIKQIQDVDDVDKVPKLTIKSISNVEDSNISKIPKIKIKPIQEVDSAPVEKCPKLIKNYCEVEEKLEKIPKLTIKQIQDSENGRKSPKLAVFSTISDDNTEKDCLSDESDFLGESSSKEENSSNEDIQVKEPELEVPKENEKREKKQEGDFCKTSPMNKRSSEIETIVLTDEASEEVPVMEDVEMKAQNVDENCVENKEESVINLENTKTTEMDSNLQSEPMEGNLEDENVRISPDEEVVFIGSSSISEAVRNNSETIENQSEMFCQNINRSDLIKTPSSDNESKLIQNPAMSLNVPNENSNSSSSISIDCEDEKMTSKLFDNTSKTMNDKTVDANSCSSLNEEDVVEALMAVLKHYQEGGNSQMQAHFLGSELVRFKENKNDNLLVSNSSNFQSTEIASSDDDVVIVNSDRNDYKMMNIDDTMASTSKHIENFCVTDLERSDLNIDEDNSKMTGEIANSFFSSDNFDEKTFEKNEVIETVDLTLSPRSQPDEGYQGTSLLGRLLSQPPQKNMMACMNTMIPSTTTSWMTNEGNLKMHASIIDDFSNKINYALEKENVTGNKSDRETICDAVQVTSLDESKLSSESILNTSFEKKTTASEASQSSDCYNTTVLNEIQHSPATSLENLLNNINENSLEDIQYLSSKRKKDKDVLEVLESLEALQTNKTLKMLQDIEGGEECSSKAVNIFQYSDDFTSKQAMDDIEDYISKEQNKSFEIIDSHEQNSNSEKDKINASVNRNEHLEMLTMLDGRRKRENNRFNNSLKRPGMEESNSSDCVEIPASKKSRCELENVLNSVTIPDSISLDSETESVMIPSSDCSLNHAAKDVQSNTLTETESSSATSTSGEHDVKMANEANSSDSERVKAKNESTVDLKMLLARMHQSSRLEEMHVSEVDINEIQITSESIRPRIAVIQEGPVRHHSRKSKHNVLINDNEESGSDELVNNMAAAGSLMTFANSIQYDKKNYEIDSGVDVSGSLQSETCEFQRQPLKRPRGRPRKDGLPAGSVKKLSRAIGQTPPRTTEISEIPPVMKRKYRRRLLLTENSETVTQSEVLKDSIPTVISSLESPKKRSDTPSALSSCSIPSPTIPNMIPEILTANSSENSSPTSILPATSSSSFLTTPSPKESNKIQSTLAMMSGPIVVTTSALNATTSPSLLLTSTATTTTPVASTTAKTSEMEAAALALVTPKISSSSKRGGRGGKSIRGGKNRGAGRSRQRCIGGLSHTPEKAKEGSFFLPEHRKILETKVSKQSSVPQVFEEDTRMSAESIAMSAPPARQSEATTNNDDTQSSVLSSASASIIDGNTSTTTITTITNTNIASTTTPVAITGSKKKSKSKMEVIAPEGKTEYTVDMIAEYDWPPPKGCCPAKNRDTFMIQEQIAQYLGIKSFKRKYPDLPRRQIDMEERNWLQEKGLVTEKMCDLGITAVWASDVLDIMYSDFYDKYEEYKTYIRQKHLRDIEAKQKAMAAEAVDRTLQARDRALQSAAKWNSNFNRIRKEDRRLCLDLQNLIINKPVITAANKSRPDDVVEQHKQQPSNYPIALVPGQFSEYYRQYTPEELRQYPINTVLDLPEDVAQRLQPPKLELKAEDELHQSDDENELISSSSCSSDYSDSNESDSSSDDDDSDSSSSSDEDEPPDGLKCFVCHQPQNKNLYGNPELFVRCYTCRRQTHPSCIEMPHRMATRILNYNWQCAECKCCIKCKRKTDESKMIYCEQCDRGYHIYCVRVKSIPEGRWHCELCSICMRCGTNKPEGNIPLQTTTPSNSKWKPKRKWIHEYRVDPLTKIREHVSILCAPCFRSKRNSKPPS